MTYNAPGTVYYQEAQALLDFGEEQFKIYTPKVDVNRTPKVKGAKPPR